MYAKKNDKTIPNFDIQIISIRTYIYNADFCGFMLSMTKKN